MKIYLGEKKNSNNNKKIKKRIPCNKLQQQR